jgi:hypothetical protein
MSSRLPNGDNIDEYVVKLKAGVDGRETGLAAELIASQVATAMAIPTPEPAIIEKEGMRSFVRRISTVTVM